MRGMKAQGIPRSTLPFIAVSLTAVALVRWLISQPFQPYLTYASLGLTVLLSIFKGFDAFMPFDIKTFITSYIGIPVFVFGYLGFKRKLKMASAAVFNVSDQGHQVRQARRDGSHFGIARVRRP